MSRFEAQSWVEVYAVRQNGDITRYGEAENAFGGAMHIWLKLKGKYRIGEGRTILDGFKTLWQSIQMMSVSDKWVLASTFDRIIIPKEQLPTLIRHLTTFMKTAPHTTLAEELKILKQASHDGIRGICFNQTSVNDNPWYIYGDGDGRPYNVDIDVGHKWLTPEVLAQMNTEVGA